MGQTHKRESHTQAKLIHLYFGKPTNEIDARTLGTCLLESTAILQQIGLEQKSHVDLAMRVRPFKPGSFEVPVELYVLVAGMLYQAREYMPLVQKSLEVFVEFLKLKKILKGREPAEVVRTDEKCMVKAADGSTINIQIETLNLFQNNGAANASLERQFKQLEEDNSVDRYQVTDNRRKDLFTSERSDFGAMSKNAIRLHHDPFTDMRRVSLYINKPVLDKKASSWRFIYEGNPISATMQDPQFLERVSQGERFAMGDRLEADMRIKQEYDESLQTYRIKSREIVKVHMHVPRPVQGTLDFGKVSP
jgi:hypothetical protein